MTDCDMCGKKESAQFDVKIEGTIMKVCSTCKEFGTPIQKPTSMFRTKKRVFQNPDEEKEIVQEYSSLIKRAREKQKLSIAQLASAVQEKESVISSFESGSRSPTLKTAKKLERKLGIKLIQKITSEGVEIEKKEFKPLTMEEKILAALKKKQEGNDK